MRDKYIFIGVGIMAIMVAVLFSLSRSGDFSATRSSGTDYSNSAATVIPFTRLIQGMQSKISTRTNYLITSSAQLSELWKTIAATGTPPTVNFSTDEVLAVFAGKESSSTIQVEKIEDTNARLVSITILKLEGMCAQKPSAASPYELVVVQNTTLPLTHEDLWATTTCKN